MANRRLEATTRALQLVMGGTSIPKAAKRAGVHISTIYRCLAKSRKEIEGKKP